MANRWWVGGNASTNWTAGTTGVDTNWGTASNTRDFAAVPTSADDVFFDGVGFGANNSTLSASINVKSIDFNGYANTLQWNNNVTLTVSGNGVTARFSSGMTLTPVGANTLTFTGTSGTNLLTTNGQPLTMNLTQNGAGGTTQLQDAFSTTGVTNAIITLTAGTLDSNNKNVTCRQFVNTSASTRVLTMGSSTWTITNSTANPWNTTSSGLTLNKGTSVILMNGTGTNNKTFVGGGMTYNDLTFVGENFLISGSNTFNTLTAKISSSSVNGFRLTSTTTQTCTNFYCMGSLGTLVNFKAVTGASAATLSVASGNVCCNYLTVQDITGSGGATFNMGANSTNVSGNTGLNFRNCYPSGLWWTCK